MPKTAMIPRIARAFSQIIVTSVVLPSSSTSVGVPGAFIDALDNRIREELGQTSQHLYFWVVVSAYVVAAGCLFEGPEILFELWPKLFVWFTWNSDERLKKFEHRLKIAGLIGWLIIIFGVAGEGVFEGFQNRAEGQLQTFNDILLTDARLTATAARDAAIRAGESATRAANAADRAEATANGLSARASALEHGQKDVENDLVLKGSRAELLGKPDVFVKLKEALKPIAGQKVDVRYPSDKEEGEALQTAEELASIMRDAGVAATLPMLAPSSRITGVAVYVTMRASATTKEHALILANALLAVPLVLRRNRSIPNPPPFGETYDSVIAREPQKFRPGVEPPPFDDETIVVLVAPHP